VTEETLSTQQPGERILACCDYCGSSDGTYVSGELMDVEGQVYLPDSFKNEVFRLLRCANCQLTYLKSRPNSIDLPIYYSGEYKCFQDYSERGFVMSHLARLLAKGKLKEIEEYMPASNRLLLDYGAGSGTWMSLLRDCGANFDMVGTDISELGIKQLNKRGITGYVCDDTNLFEFIKPESVGVIHNFHVIEHVPSPAKMLQELYRALTPGGVLMGQTPNVSSFGNRAWGDLWNQWHVPRHFVLFNHDTLRRHAERAGFEVISIKSSISSATQWAQSSLLWLSRVRKRDYRSIEEPLYAPLIFAFLPIVVIEYIFSQTCHMDFVLRRPKS